MFHILCDIPSMPNWKLRLTQPSPVESTYTAKQINTRSLYSIIEKNEIM